MANDPIIELLEKLGVQTNSDAAVEIISDFHSNYFIQEHSDRNLELAGIASWQQDAKQKISDTTDELEYICKCVLDKGENVTSDWIRRIIKDLSGPEPEKE